MDCGSFNANRTGRLFNESERRGYRRTYTKSVNSNNMGGTLIGLAAIGVLGIIAWKTVFKPIAKVLDSFADSIVEKDEPRVVHGDSRIFSGKPYTLTKEDLRKATTVEFSVVDNNF